jgi:hypothetical protein
MKRRRFSTTSSASYALAPPRRVAVLAAGVSALALVILFSRGGVSNVHDPYPANPPDLLPHSFPHHSHPVTPLATNHVHDAASEIDRDESARSIGPPLPPTGAALLSNTQLAQPLYVVPSTQNIPGYGTHTDRDETMHQVTALPLSDAVRAAVAHASHRLNGVPVTESSPDGTPARVLREAFLRYNAEPTADYNLPVYGTACVDPQDCDGVLAQLERLDTGVGHVVVVQAYADLNTRPNQRLTELQRQFPSRFTLAELRTNDSGGLAEARNAILAVGFSIVPPPDYVLMVAGAVVARPGTLAYVATQCRSLAHKYFSLESAGGDSAMLAVTRLGFEHVGWFDENAFPARGEDDEWVQRTWRLMNFVDNNGRFAAPDASRSMNRELALVQPGQAYTRLDGGNADHVASDFFRVRGERWDPEDYLVKRWGTDGEYATPYDIPDAPASWVWVDPDLRTCLTQHDPPDTSCRVRVDRMKREWAREHEHRGRRTLGVA